MARLHANGTLDMTFAPEINGAALTHSLLPDGRILFGGSFGQVNRTNISNIARVLGDIPIPVGTSLLTAQPYMGMLIYGSLTNQYRIEYLTTLNPPRLWTPLTNLILPTSPYLFIDRDSPNHHARFYRTVTLP